MKGRIDEQERVLGDTLPLLRALYAREKNKPQVRVYEGIAGMKSAYLDIVWKSKTEVLFFSSIKKITETFPDLLNIWLKHVNDRTNPFQSKTREIINPDPEDLDYGRRAAALAPNEDRIRVLPKDFPRAFVGTDNAIFEDKIMMVSFEDKLFTTIIQSQVLTDTMRTLYELAWRSAEPISVSTSSIESSPSTT